MSCLVQIPVDQLNFIASKFAILTVEKSVLHFLNSFYVDNFGTYFSIRMIQITKLPQQQRWGAWQHRTARCKQNE